MRRTGKSRSGGSALLESAMWIPILVTIMVGTIELGKVTYTYYTLHKILYTVGRMVGTQQGINFCDPADTTVTTLKEFAINGGNDTDATPIVTGLTAERIAVRIERYNTDSQALEECDCSSTGCDISAGGRAPDYVVVSITDGYPMRLIIPGLNLDPIPLRPQVRVPFGGT